MKGYHAAVRFTDYSRATGLLNLDKPQKGLSYRCCKLGSAQGSAQHQHFCAGVLWERITRASTESRLGMSASLAVSVSHHHHDHMTDDS
jgi:hypothetical protein